MAVKKKQKEDNYNKPADDTIVEVVFINGDQVKKYDMTYAEALAVKPKEGWRKDYYQKGFSQFNTDKK